MSPIAHAVSVILEALGGRKAKPGPREKGLQMQADAALAGQILWCTEDGRVMAPRDMETSHVRACIAMLRRKGYVSLAERPPFPEYPCLSGDMAQFFAEQAWESELDAYYAVKPNPWIDVFEAELKRRDEPCA